MSEIIYGQVAKRTVKIGNIKTAVSLEDCFWLRLKAIAKRRKVSLERILTDIDFDRSADDHRGTKGNLSSAVRQFILHDLQEQLDSMEMRAAIALPSQGVQADQVAAL